MTAIFREATGKDIPAILALLQDDYLGVGREAARLEDYLAGFDAMRAESNNYAIVGLLNGDIVATYQLTFISGISLSAARRAQIEGVRVSASVRGHGIGEALIADAEARARAAGCTLLQLTMNKTRTDAQRFYERVGFTPSHIGFKRDLS